MKFRLSMLVICCALILQAQMQMNVDQLAQFIRSELALKQHTDKQLAAYLKTVALTEKLPDKTIEDLEEQGAGPKTVEALRNVQKQAATLKPPAADPTYSPGTEQEKTPLGSPTVALRAKIVIPPPDSVRQQQILDQIRQYALSYTQSLPNFLCVEVVRQFIEPNRGRGADSYHSIGDILAKVSYNQGHEDYKVYSVNGKYTETSMENLTGGGAVSTGEFGSMMREIFEPKSEAEFKWDHWAKLRDRRMAVFHYAIDGSHTQYSISYSSGPGDQQRIYTAYEGLVYADEYTGEITRITFHAINIPNTFPVREADERLDYEDVDINGQKYVAPLLAQLTMSAVDGKTKNEIEFRNYRKFGTESNITFGTEVPPPLSSEKTEEQPVTPSKNDTKNLPKPASSSDPWNVPTLPPPPPK